MGYITSLERQGFQRGFQEGMDEGFRQGVKEGMERGIHQGIYQGLYRLLECKFQIPVISDYIGFMHQADNDTLLKWIESALEVKRMKEVFKDKLL